MQDRGPSLSFVATVVMMTIMTIVRVLHGNYQLIYAFSIERAHWSDNSYYNIPGIHVRYIIAIAVMSTVTLDFWQWVVNIYFLPVIMGLSPKVLFIRYNLYCFKVIPSLSATMDHLINKLRY